MNQLVPPRFLFRWSFTARRLQKSASMPRELADLPETYRLTSLAELDGRADFAQVKLAWNENGLGFSFAVAGKTRLPKFVANEPLLSDRIQIWIDTRNSQTVHRATRYCQSFLLFPTGGGVKRQQPLVRAVPVLRAREEVTLPDVSSVGLHGDVTDLSYQLSCWLPSTVLTGFDPESNPRIGFHYAIHDSELGEQTLAVGSEFPYESDPSLWQNVEFLP